MVQRTNFKINIGLYVTSRRSDGFHNIETIFYPVDHVCDVITMERIPQGLEFKMEGADYGEDIEKNLCVKAYRLLQKHYSIEGVRIHLQKHIPAGAGLGGGSSDAATVLKMANQLFDLQIDENTMLHLAELLGSDVPFFVKNRPSYATGKGEILSDVGLHIENKSISVFKPDFSISTAEAYAHIKPKSGRTPLPQLVEMDLSHWKETITNDFELALASKYPMIAQIKQKFYDLGADYASLSGSGSALYAIADFPIDVSPYFQGQNL